MIVRTLRILPGLAAVMAVAPAPSRAQTAPPAALVISNSNYAALPKLPMCQISANLVSAVLTRSGFKVTRQTDLSNARLGTAIANLGEDAAASPGSRSIIYICTYAVSYSDRLFILPAEVRLDREADVLSQGIVARLLMSSVAGIGSEAGLVLMDVAPPPGRAALEFGSMLRPADAAHGGLIAAALPAAETGGPAPLAAALSDVAASGEMEVQTVLAALASQPGVRKGLLTLRAPSEPSWFVGRPAPVAAAAPAAPPQPPVEPVVSTPAVVAAPPAPPPVVAAPSLPPPVVAAPTATPDAAPATALADPNPAEKRRLQLALSRLGYYRGPVDGTFALGTAQAIRQFQRDSNAEPTGKLTVRQMDQLLQ